jgi:branched-chain amino acid transport system permease protein
MIQYLWFGVVSGAFLLIATIGFALTSRVNKFLNIAHAEYMSVSALATYYLTAEAGLPFLVGAALSVAGVAVLGLLIARLVYDPMLARGAEVLLILSVGVVYLLHGVTEFVVSPGTKSFAIPAWEAWRVGPVSVTPYQLIIVALAAVCFAGLHLYLTRTSAGTSIRAIADNRELAEIRGINVRRATREVWLVSSGLAGIAGICLGMLGTLTTDVAFEQILLVLAVSILAGLGSVYGVAVAALVLGIAMDLSTMVIPSGYRTAVAFVLIIAVLLLRPQGLFGKKVRVA